MLKLFPSSLLFLAFLPILSAQKFYESAPINYYQSEPVDKISDYFSDPENLNDWQRSGTSGYLQSFLEKDIRKLSEAPPAEREGLAGWEEDWRHDHGASPRVTKVIIDAMARYLSHLRTQGSSPRTLSSVCADLNAAGHLVLMYDAPRGNRILVYFDEPPWEFEFRRKFTDTPTLVARYRRNLEGFAHFLRESGELPMDDE